MKIRENRCTYPHVIGLLQREVCASTNANAAAASTVVVPTSVSTSASAIFAASARRQAQAASTCVFMGSKSSTAKIVPAFARPRLTRTSPQKLAVEGTLEEQMEDRGQVMWLQMRQRRGCARSTECQRPCCPRRGGKSNDVAPSRTHRLPRLSSQRMQSPVRLTAKRTGLYRHRRLCFPTRDGAR